MIKCVYMLPLVCAYTSTHGLTHSHGHMNTRVHTHLFLPPLAGDCQAEAGAAEDRGVGGGGGSPCVELGSEMTYAGLHSEGFQAAWGCIWLGIKGGSQGVLPEHDYTPPF